MGLAKCVQVGFLVFLCLIICSASRLLLDSTDFKEAKNGQSHVASATTVGDGSGSLGVSLNMAHVVHSEPIKKIGEANMVHSEPIINPFSFDSTLKKNKVGEAHSEPIINPFSFEFTLKEKQDGEGEARSTNQRAVSEPEQLVNAVHKIEDGLRLQEAAPPLY